MCIRMAAVLVVLGSVIGCGGGDVGGKGKDPVYPVNGTVTYNGKAVAGADVKFESESGKRSAFGRTDEQGRFKLSTFGANDGAIAGKHSVTVTKATLPTSAPTGKVADTFSPDYEPPKLITESDPGFKKPQAKPEIPAKYGTAATSGLIAIVNPEPMNEAKLELTD